MTDLGVWGLLITAAFGWLWFLPAKAQHYQKLCNPAKERCWLASGSSTSSPAYPSKSSSISINPSAVPIEKLWGIEGITYKNDWDVSIVKGTGRVGAALSPTQGEEVFFGPPGLEPDPEYLERKIALEKYDSQKVNLATAFGLLNNKKRGLKQFLLNIGVMGKYNTVSSNLHGGVGLSAIIGPLTLGVARSDDEYVLENEKYGLTSDLVIPYDLETTSVGLFLNSFAVDYSELKMIYEDNEISRVSLITASLLTRKVIVTVSRRREDSYRPAYNFETKSLEIQQVKYETFGGVQVALTKTLMAGLFYNYYLLREGSLGLTLFF